MSNRYWRRLPGSIGCKISNDIDIYTGVASVNLNFMVCIDFNKTVGPATSLKKVSVRKIFVVILPYADLHCSGSAIINK
jgi:hypothetical protein